MKILLFESDPIRIEIFKQKLSGHQIFFAQTTEKALEVLGNNTSFDQVYFGNEPDGEEVAMWITQHEMKRPYRIVIHDFSVPGAQNILNILPEASFLPGVWLLNRMEF